MATIKQLPLRSCPQPKLWKDLTRHPLSDKYEDLSGVGWENLVDDLQTIGNVGSRPVVLYEGKVIDAWQFQLAHVASDVKPLYATLPDGIDPEQYVRIMNDNRRHEDAEKIAARRERAKDARINGESIRTIAEKEGVSTATVRRDLDKSPDSKTTTCDGGVTPDAEDREKAKEEPLKVTGKDGKTYPATKPKKEPILCNACQRKKRVGQALPKDCPECKELRPKKPKKPKEPPKPDPKYAGLPKDVANALADEWHVDCAKTLKKMQTEAKSAFSWSYYLNHEVLKYLKLAEECFTTAAPRKKCPDCDGQKKIDKQPCANCHGCGYLASHA